MPINADKIRETLVLPFPGPLFQRELQIPAPSSAPKEPAGNQRQKQPDPAEEHGHAGSTDAARQRHDACHAATAHGEKTHPPARQPICIADPPPHLESLHSPTHSMFLSSWGGHHAYV